MSYQQLPEAVANEEFVDVKLTPDCRLSVYRITDDNHEKVKYTKVLFPDGTAMYARGSAETQLMHHLWLSIRGLEQMQWQQRDTVVARALVEDRNNEIVLRVYNNTIYAAVTEEYVPIRTKSAIDIAEEVMTEDKVGFAKRGYLNLGSKTYTKYLFKDKLDSFGISTGLIIINSVRGLASLSFSGYWEVLICSNGLKSTDEVMLSRQVHRGNAELILDLFRSKLHSFLSAIKPMSELAKPVPLAPANVQTLVERLNMARKYKAKVLFELQYGKYASDKSTLGIANAISLVAQQAPPKVRLTMEEMAYESLLRPDNISPRFLLPVNASRDASETASNASN